LCFCFYAFTCAVCVIYKGYQQIRLGLAVQDCCVSLKQDFFLGFFKFLSTTPLPAYCSSVNQCCSILLQDEINICSIEELFGVSVMERDGDLFQVILNRQSDPPEVISSHRYSFVVCIAQYLFCLRVHLSLKQAPLWSSSSVLDHRSLPPCSNLGVGISEGCFIFDLAALPLWRSLGPFSLP